MKKGETDSKLSGTVYIFMNGVPGHVGQIDIAMRIRP
jgi:hypothetical protein